MSLRKSLRECEREQRESIERSEAWRFELYSWRLSAQWKTYHHDGQTEIDTPWALDGAKKYRDEIYVTLKTFS